MVLITHDYDTAPGSGWTSLDTGSPPLSRRSGSGYTLLVYTLSYSRTTALAYTLSFIAFPHSFFFSSRPSFHVFFTLSCLLFLQVSSLHGLKNKMFKSGSRRPRRPSTGKATPSRELARTQMLRSGPLLCHLVPEQAGGLVQEARRLPQDSFGQQFSTCTGSGFSSRREFFSSCRECRSPWYGAVAPTCGLYHRRGLRWRCRSLPVVSLHLPGHVSRGPGSWKKRRNRRSRAEAVATSAAGVPIEEPEYSPPPESREPAGTLGALSQMHPRLKLSLSHAWACLPREVVSISWEDLFASRRRDAMIVYQTTSVLTRGDREPEQVALHEDR